MESVTSRVDDIRQLSFFLGTGRLSLLLDRLREKLGINKRSPLKPELFPCDKDGQEVSFPVSKEPSVSIIVPVFNKWEVTCSCLKSIIANTADVSYEVILADDASSDETKNASKYVKNINLVRSEENLGFLLNCNNAAKSARGRYLVFLNNDTNVQKDWLAPMVSLLEADKTIGMSGSKLLYPDGYLQEAGGIIWQDASGWNFGRNDYPDRPEYSYAKDVDYISGASILVRRDLWEDIGGFDERYVPAYYEDTDLAFEVRRRGYRVVLQPASAVVHLEGVSHGTSTESGLKAFQEANKEKFLSKWKDVLIKENAEGPKEIFRARDRSVHKKVLLFIDHYVPWYDQDAGSRATFQYLKLMLSMGYRVKFIGDSFIEHQPYTRVLQSLGVEVLHGGWYKRNWKKWISLNGGDIDYVVLSRPHITRKYIDHVRKHTQAKLIYFGHDLHYLREGRRYKLTGDVEYRKAAKKWEKREKAILRKVDVGYFFSEYEIVELERSSLPSRLRAIPLFLYEDEEVQGAQHPGHEDRSGLLFVGGFRHEPNTDGVSWFVANVYPRLKKQIPELQFVVAGSEPPPEITQLNGGGVKITGYISDEELENEYWKARLVVAPLRFGAGVKGKIVEALSHGVPVITTSVGAEGIPESDALVVEDDPVGMARKIVEYYEDAALWEQSASAAKKVISNHYSFNVARELLSIDMPL